MTNMRYGPECLRRKEQSLRAKGLNYSHLHYDGGDEGADEEKIGTAEDEGGDKDGNMTRIWMKIRPGMRTRRTRSRTRSRRMGKRWRDSWG